MLSHLLFRETAEVFGRSHGSFSRRVLVTLLLKLLVTLLLKLFGIYALIVYVLGHRHGSIDADVVIFPLGGIALHQAGESLVLSF
jgi:hypothetical protein